jgi:hypothetical protein
MAKQYPPNWNKMSHEDRALWEYLNAGDEFVNEGAPQYQWQGDLAYEQLGSAPQLGRTGLDSVTTDPRLLESQMKALAALEAQADSGLSAGDENALNRTSRKLAADQAANAATIEQRMARQGRAGGRLGVTMQMQAAQAAQQAAADDAANRNAMAQEGRLNARMGAGNMAGNMSAEEYRRKAQAAQAQDVINRFNTANTINRQEYNNRLANQATQANWQGRHGIADQNTQANYGYRKDKMGTQQGNAQMAYNKAADDYNRAQMKKQKKANRTGDMFSGAAQGATAGAAFGPWGAAAGGVLGAAANFAQGGKIPGRSPFPGDDEMNDIFAAQLSPGEVVVPRTLTDDPEKAGEFVAAVNQGMDPMAAKYVAQNEEQKAAESKKLPFYPTPTGAPIPGMPKYDRRTDGGLPAKPAAKSIPEPVLAKLAEKNPSLVEQYRARMAESDKSLADAKDRQGFFDKTNAVGSLLNTIGNGQREDVILKNRMQDLGRAPEVVEAKRSQYDGSMLDKLGARGVQQAKEGRESAENQFMTEQKLVSADKAAALSDPNSPESASARAFLKALVPSAKGIDNMSAAQLEKAAPLVMEKWKADQAQSNFNRELAVKAGKTSGTDPKTTKEVAYRTETLQGNLDKLQGIVDRTGTFEALGPESAQMDSLIYQIAVDYAKLVDPESVAREGEVAAAQKYMLPVQGLFVRNSTAKSLIQNMKQDVDSRRVNFTNPAAAQQARLSSQNGVVQMVGPDGSTYNIPADEVAEAEADGLKRK